MNVRTKKAKGRRLQKRVVELILKYFPELSEDDVRSVPSSVPGSDIQLSAYAKQLIPFSIECKNQERINLYKFWEQAKVNGMKERLEPLLVVKSNFREELAVLRLEYLIKLISEVKDGKRKIRGNNKRGGGKVGKEEL